MWKSPGDWSGEERSSLIFKGDAVGVVELKGIILESKKILAQLERFKESKKVKAVVLRLDSPGGSVAPSQEIYEAVKEYPKPLVVSMGSVAASGAYYIACGSKKVFANAGTITGSIGVIMEFINLTDLYQWAKMKPYVIKTGKYKDSGSAHRDMRPDERELFQEMIDDVLLQFKTAVSEGRKLKMSSLKDIADGRVFSGQQAKELKLVDEVGTLQNAIDAAAELGEIKGKPRVIYARKKKLGWMDAFLEYDPDDEDSRAPGWLSQLFPKNSSAWKAFEERATVAFTPGLYWLWNGAQ